MPENYLYMNSLIIIISNPAARKSSLGKIQQASELLRQKGFSPEILLTEKSGDATRLARDAVSKKPFFIVAAGGDGTINEVINGIAHADTPLAILPLGTTNVLAKELSIPENIPGALEAALTRTPKSASLGKIELRSGPPRYFCLMAGIGFDGKAVHDINLSIKKISGKIAYIISGITNFLNYDPAEFSLNIDGRSYSGYSAIIGKASRYGGNFKVTPDADIASPVLYTAIFKGRKRRDLLGYVAGVLRGTHLKRNDVAYTESSTIEILGSAHIQIDGDYLGTAPAKVAVEKDVLRIIF